MRPTAGRFSLADRIDRLDPVAVVVVLHAGGLALTGSLQRPAVVLALVAVLVAARLGIGFAVRRRPGSRRVLFLWRGAVTTLAVAAAVTADGGTESPLFFWFLIVLAWQALILDRSAFLVLGGLAALSYIGVVVAASDLTATSIARFGLFVAFILVLAAGRVVLEDYESRIRRLDATASAVVGEMPLAVAVLDADRETVLYANAAAHEMGLDDREAMAQLVPRDRAHSDHIITLAELVDQRAWGPSRVREFHPIRRPDRRYRIGFEARKLEDGVPIVLLYGEDLAEPAPG